MENFTGGTNKIFDAANNKLKSLTKNNMYLIITAIIGYILKKIPEDNIIKSIEKCIISHFFVSCLDDKDKQEKYKLHDGILYEAGGNFIDNRAKDYLKTPHTISSKITKDIIILLLEDLMTENIKDKKYEIRTNGKDKNDKRRARKVFEKVLIYYYYKCKVPNQFLNNNFWIEHIFPFSSSWDDLIDIDRLGNIIPIIESANREILRHIRALLLANKSQDWHIMMYVAARIMNARVVNLRKCRPKT
jgi:hypothetical protein